MLLTKLSLINRACAIIGADPIDALDDDTPGAQIVSLRYDSVLEFCVGLEDFSFCTSTRRLSKRDGVDILNGWSNCFALPADRIGQPIRIGDSAYWSRTNFTDYLIEGNDAFANTSELYAQIRVLPDPAAMSATFRRTFETGLAAELAMGLASDKALRAQLLNDAFGPSTMNGVGGMMASVIQANRREQPSKGMSGSADPLTSAHRGGAYGGFSFP